MKTLTDEEFQKKYGVTGLSKFKTPTKEAGVFSQIKDAASAGVSKMQQGFEQSKTGVGNTPLNAIEGGLKVGAGAIETAFSPLAPVFAPIGKGINAVADKISDSQTVQKFADSSAGQTTARVAEDVVDLTTIAGGVMGAKGTPGAARAAASGVAKGAGDLGGAVSKVAPKAGADMRGAGDIVRDAIPTKAGMIDENLTKALDLTQGDLANLEVPLGEFMTGNKLVGPNRAATENLVRAFNKKQYDLVRSEIAEVQKIYKPTQIPRFVDTLKQIQKKVEGVAGLEDTAVQIENMLNKKDLSLADVQTAKELIDKHAKIYDKAGEPGASAEKLGLDTMRKGLRKFIEDEVAADAKARGKDVNIGQMNRDVSVSRDLVDAIELRETRGLTRNNISLRDAIIGTGLFFGSTPWVGAAYILATRIAESPTARLRFVRFLDSLPVSKKKAVNEALLKGEVPAEVQAAIEST